MNNLKQVAANRENAKLSTGPRTAEGKRIVSGNRITHGILSTKLLLENESAEDYQALLDDLQQQLRPVGSLEQVLVERIAVSLWRQRRMVQAETATISLGITPTAIASTVSEGMGISRHSGGAISTEDLEPPDQEQIDWCRSVIAECEGIADLNLSKIQQTAPRLFEQLTREAEGEEIPVAEYLSQVGGLADYIQELVAWSEKELGKAERYAQIAQLMVTAVDKLCIPWNRLNVFNKYQASLDNQTYKAMKALREAQEWRLKTIDAEPALESEDGAEAA